jgi:fatty-acyl-CoA synthase
MYHFDWIQRYAERTPDKLALVDAHSGQQFSYAQFNERANRLAHFFVHQLGLQTGDRVSILAHNSADYHVALFACAKSSTILNTLNWRLTVPELAYILNDCQPRAIVVDKAFAETAVTLHQTVQIAHWLILGDTAAAGSWQGAQARAARHSDGQCLS